MIPNSIQLYRVLEEQWCGRYHAHNSSRWQNSNGNWNVPVLYKNERKRNLDLNWIENDWNENYRFLTVRNCFYSPPMAEFSF